MAEAYYEPTPATDGATMNPVPGAVFEVFEIADTTFSTPLSLRVGSGNPTTTVTASDTLATLPGVYVTSPNYEHIFKSGTFEWRRDSIDGAKKAIEDAKLAASNSASASDASAVSAASSAQAAQDAAALVDAPADTVLANLAGNPDSQFATQLSATIASEVAPTVARISPAGSRGLAFAGDSNTASGVTGAGVLLKAPLILFENPSWVGWAALTGAGRYHVAVHAAEPGITPGGWRTKFLAGVIAEAPYAMVEALGTNGAEVLATQTAELTAIYDALDDAGIKVIVCSIPPKAGFVADVQRLNRWKRVTARERGYLFVDNYATLVDPATGLMQAAYNSDGIHFNAVGARALGIAFNQAINAVYPDVSTLAVAQPAPADLINKPLLLVKSGFVPEDWVSLGVGSASTSVDTVAGVVGKMFTVTQTAEGNNTSTAVALNANLIPGRRYRVEYKYQLTIVGAAPTAASVRLVVTTGGGTTLVPINTQQSVPLSTVTHEFVCPTLSAYNYRLNMTMNGGGIGTKQQIGQVTITDLTAAGL